MATVKKNFVYHLLFVLQNIAFPVLVFPYLARNLGPEGIGEAQFALSFSKYFVTIASIGIPFYAVREIARAKGDPAKIKQTFFELTFINVITALISTVVYVIAILSSPRIEASQALFWVAGSQVLLGFIAIDWFFYGTEQFKVVTIRSFAIKMITMVLLLSFVNGQADVLPYLVISVGSILLNHIWNIGYAFYELGKPDQPLDLRRHIKPISVFFILNLAVSAYTVLDTSLLGFMSSNEAVGMYVAALKLNKLTIPIVTSLGMVIIPKAVHQFNRDNPDHTYLYKSYAFIVSISVPICMGLLLLAPESIYFFSGEEFAPAVTSMRILCPLVLLVGINNLYGPQILMASGNDRLLLRAVIVGMIVSLLLNVLLIPYFQQDGAAVAMCMAELSVTAYTYYLVKKTFNLRFPIRYFWQALYVSLLFVPVVFIIRYMGLPTLVMMIFSVLSCVGLYAFIQIRVLHNELWLSSIDAVVKKLKSANS